MAWDAPVKDEVAGSKAKEEAILRGANPLDVFNAGRPARYRVGGSGVADITIRRTCCYYRDRGFVAR